MGNMRGIWYGTIRAGRLGERFQNEELIRFAALEVVATISAVLPLISSPLRLTISSKEWLVTNFGSDTSDRDFWIVGDTAVVSTSGPLMGLLFLATLFVSTLRISGLAEDSGMLGLPLLLLCRNRAFPKDENRLPPAPVGTGDAGGLTSTGLELVRSMETEPIDEAVCFRCSVAGKVFDFSLLPLLDFSMLLFRLNKSPVHCFAHVIRCRTARFAMVTFTEPDFFIRYSIPQLVQKRAKRKKSNEQKRRNKQYKVIPSSILRLFLTNDISRSAGFRE